MTLDKAIAIQTIHNDHNPNFTDAERREAHQLTLEASKRFRKLREVIRIPYTDLLPGEDPIFDNTRSLHTIKKVLESPPGRESGQ
ncbi:hypothetical protein ES705_16205 [subsurface metagenome]